MHEANETATAGRLVQHRNIVRQKPGKPRSRASEVVGAVHHQARDVLPLDAAGGELGVA